MRSICLVVVLAVGFRIRSPRGTQFRQWAIERLNVDELLERIRDIRASERRFYQKILDINTTTSVDYKPDAQLSQQFFATVQNKMHWTTHGCPAAEVIYEPADSSKPFI